MVVSWHYIIIFFLCVSYFHLLFSYNFHFLFYFFFIVWFYLMFSSFFPRLSSSKSWLNIPLMSQDSIGREWKKRLGESLREKHSIFHRTFPFLLLNVEDWGNAFLGIKKWLVPCLPFQRHAIPEFFDKFPIFNQEFFKESSYASEIEGYRMKEKDSSY